jgi:hypothetical protein
MRPNSILYKGLSATFVSKEDMSFSNTNILPVLKIAIKPDEIESRGPRLFERYPMVYRQIPNTINTDIIFNLCFVNHA